MRRKSLAVAVLTIYSFWRLVVACTRQRPFAACADAMSLTMSRR